MARRLARRIDGARHRHPEDPAKARWYARQRSIRYARYLGRLAAAAG